MLIDTTIKFLNLELKMRDFAVLQVNRVVAARNNSALVTSQYVRFTGFVFDNDVYREEFGYWTSNGDI